MKRSIRPEGRTGRPLPTRADTAQSGSAINAVLLRWAGEWSNRVLHGRSRCRYFSMNLENPSWLVQCAGARHAANAACNEAWITTASDFLIRRCNQVETCPGTKLIYCSRCATEMTKYLAVIRE